MKRRDFIKTLAAAGGAAALGSVPDVYAAAAPRRPRLVLLYAPCTVNKHFLSPYNPSVTYTPHLKKFASGGAVFADVQAECGMSGTCYASMFSGCQADRHGVFEQPKLLDPSVHLITETFRAAGYDVFFWSGHPMASYKLGYGRGVDPENTVERPLLAEHDLFNKILERLAADDSYKAFVVTNFSVTHASYMPPDPLLYDELSTRGKVSDKFIDAYGEEFWALNKLPGELEAAGLSELEFDRYNRMYQEQKWIDFSYSFDNTLKEMGLPFDLKDKFISSVNYLYKLNIARQDLIFGRVARKIESAGLMKESLIAFTADHGESLYRDNTYFKYSHGFQLAPEVLSVPLIIHAPSLGVKPSTAGFPARSIDIFPTLAGLCDIPVKANYSIEGADLSPALLGAQTPPALLSRSHTNPIFELAEFNLRAAESDVAFKLFRIDNPDSIWLSVKDGREVLKLYKPSVDGPLEFALFNLDKDPEERKNIFDESNERHARLRDDLFSYKSKIVKAIKSSKDKKAPDISTDEKLKKLKEMGYLK